MIYDLTISCFISASWVRKSRQWGLRLDLNYHIIYSPCLYIHIDIHRRYIYKEHTSKHAQETDPKVALGA